MNLIKLLAVYLPFEELFLKWIPVSDQVYLLLRQIPDVIVFTLAFCILLARLSSDTNVPIAGCKIDLFLLLFIAWALLTLLLNPTADVIIGLANIKALLRYVLLIYVVLMLNPSTKQISSLVQWVMAAAACQGIIGLVQFAGGLAVRDFLAARQVQDGVLGLAKNFTGDKFDNVNDLMGTMGDNISFAFFFLVAMVLWMFSSRFNGLKYWIGIITLFLIIYLSGSRAATLTALMVIASHYVWIGGWRKAILPLSAVPLLVIALGLFSSLGSMVSSAADNTSFWFMFNSSYIETALNQRLGVMFYVVPNVLTTINNVIGFSPDMNVFIGFSVNYLPMVQSILIDVLAHIIEDVYWIAIYIYYGLVGFLFWALFLLFMLKAVRKSVGTTSAPITNYLGCVAVTLILTAIPLNFFNQAFEVRAFSFYLWLFCGLALVTQRQRHGQSHTAMTRY